jgi:hypothetical protein
MLIAHGALLLQSLDTETATIVDVKDATLYMQFLTPEGD